MKKKILYALLIVMASTLVALVTGTTAHAQVLKTVVPTKDSCVNTDNTSIDVTPTSNSVVAFHFKATKVSGTVGGSAKLQGSIDGTNWVDVGSAYAVLLCKLGRRNALGALGKDVGPHLFRFGGRTAAALGPTVAAAAPLFEMRSVEHLLGGRDDLVKISNLSLGK